MAVRQNGEPISLVDSPAERNDSGVERWEVEGNSGARVVLRATSQTPPAGIFALSTLGDYVVIERAVAATRGADGRAIVTEWEEITRFTGDGAEFTWDEDAIEDLVDTLILMVASGHGIGLKFRQLVQLAMIS